MPGNSKNRANWKRKFELDRKDKHLPLVKFALYARDNATPEFRKAICLLDGFGAAFDAELDVVNDEKVLEDLTAHERAFCEGWAILARRQCYDAGAGEINDAKLRDWINDHLQAPPWPEIMAG